MKPRVAYIGNFKRHAYAHHWQGIELGHETNFGDIQDVAYMDYRELCVYDPVSGHLMSEFYFIKQLRAFAPHVVIFCIQDAMTDAVLSMCQDLKAFTVLWFCDLRVPEKRDLSTRLNFLVMSNHGMRDQYINAWGLDDDNVRWLPQGCLPSTEMPEPTHGYHSEIMHIGSKGHPQFHSARRNLFIEVRRRFGGGFVEFSPQFDDQKEKVTADLDKWYPSADVCVGISEPVAGYHSNRIFLVTGHAGFYFCNHYPGIEKLFVPGEEVETFDVRQDLKTTLDRLEYLVSDESAAYRRRVRIAGWKRAQSEHTYNHRIPELWTMIRRRM